MSNPQPCGECRQLRRQADAHDSLSPTPSLIFNEVTLCTSATNLHNLLHNYMVSLKLTNNGVGAPSRPLKG